MRSSRTLTLLATAPLVLGLVPVDAGGVVPGGTGAAAAALSDAADPSTDALAPVTDAFEPVTAAFEPVTAALEPVTAAVDDTFSSPNLVPVGLVPDATVISMVFATDAPLMYASTLTGIRTYDVSDPTLPKLLGVLPMAVFQNENVKLGERADGTKFLLVGLDLVGVTPTADPTDVGTVDEIVVVDVTDPTDPYIRSRVEVGTDTHTVGCANPACTHAYSSGRGAAFDVVDLSDLDAPVVLDQVTGQPMEANDAFSTGIGHDWDVDDAEVAWWVGTGGIVGYDVTDPTDPVVLNSSDENGRAAGWNDFISHNSLRPNADRFSGPRLQRPGSSAPRGGAKGHARSTAPDSGEPHVDRGNVLLVTEEDYVDATCASEGSFQTWHVPDLDPTVNPDGVQDAGTITPLDRWNTELLGTGIPTPAGAFCSAHYFDFHQDGYVAQGWYQQGLRILDVDDPEAIRQVGYWVTGVQETWGARWVPEYDEDGRQTGDKTDLVYTADPTRGLEILRVDLPEERGAAPTVTAPVLASWLTATSDLTARAAVSPFGGACVLPPGAGRG